MSFMSLTLDNLHECAVNRQNKRALEVEFEDYTVLRALL